MKLSNIPSTLLATVGPRRLPARGDRRRYGMLFVEAVFYTTVAVMLTRAWAEEAVIFSIFLAAGALVRRFTDLLDENRELVWGDSARARKEANVLTASSLLMLFLGVFAVYFLLMLLIGVDAAISGFKAAFDAARVDVEGPSSAFVVRNLLVLVSFFVLAFIYQAYGATLAICWTACAWALALTVVLDAQLASDRPAWLALALTICAVLPHSVLKAFGCIAGALAAIFLARGLLRYGLRDPKLKPVLGAVVLLALVSVVCVCIAAFLEVTLSRWLL